MFGLWFGGSHLGYGTHLPILAAAVLNARPGPLLEYGLGFYSTPLLHCFAHEQERQLLSLENDVNWAAQFEGVQDHFHKVAAVPNWEASEAIVDAAAQDWAVVFIDHGPNERRLVDARRLAHRAEFVVVHDWDDAAYAELAALFKFKWVSKCGPLTAVLSNVRPFPGLGADLIAH
jgi:hypothetical protein